MEKYFHTDVKGVYTVKRIEDAKRPVALIFGEEFRFMVNSGEDVAEVRDYCQRKGIWFSYSHETLCGTCFIYENISHRTVAVVDQDKVFHFLPGTGENELEVKWYAVKNNLCDIVALMHARHGMRDIIANGKEEVVAIIDNVGNEKYFSFFDWSGVNEVDVRLYCKLNNLYSE